MGLLSRHARRIATEAGVRGVHFETSDLLRCSYCDDNVLLLASQCWDAALVRTLAAKLLLELPKCVRGK